MTTGVMQGPKRNPRDPWQNKRGHQFGKPLASEGYGTCSWCKCSEASRDSGEQCPEAVMLDVSGKTEWFRRSKYGALARVKPPRKGWETQPWAVELFSKNGGAS